MSRFIKGSRERSEYDQMLDKMVEDQEPKIKDYKEKRKFRRQIKKLIKDCLDYLIDKENKVKAYNLLTIFNYRIDQDTDMDGDGINC